MRAAKKLSIALVSLLVVLVAGELATRFFEPGPFTLMDRNPYLPRWGFAHVHRPGFRGSWDGTWYETNSLGMRGPEMPRPWPEEDLRVVALGDSCTFGKGVDEADCFPRKLEALLRERVGGRRGAVVANLGVNGFGPHQYEFLFRARGRALVPDIVIVGCNINDFPNPVKAVDHAVYQGRGNLRAMLPTGMRELAGKLALGRFLRHAYYQWNRDRFNARSDELAARARPPEGEQRVLLEERLGCLRKLVAGGGAAGAEPLLFIFPYEAQVVGETYDSSPIDVVRELAAEVDAPFVDMIATFRAEAARRPGEPLFLFGDRYHPSARGYRLVAENLFEAIETRGWLEEGAGSGR